MIRVLADACDPRLPGCKREPNAGGILLVVALVAIVVAVLVLALIVGLSIRRSKRRRTAGAMPAGPGWFPDPVGRFPMRYWDGARWTASVSDGTSTRDDPMPGS